MSLSEKYLKAVEFDVLKVDAAYNPKVSETRTPLGDWADGAYFENKQRQPLDHLVARVIEACVQDSTDHKGFVDNIDRELKALREHLEKL